MSVNLEVKGTLARLLAQEDLIVELLATHLLYSSPILNTTYD